MEIIVNSKELENALICISKVLPSKSTMEILSGILIEGKDELNLISTDLENTIKVSMKCNFKKGTILIPGKQFISLVKQIPNEEIKITQVENEIEVSNENIKYKFITMNVEDFPKISKITPKINFTLNGRILKDAIELVKFCVDPNEPRPHFKGGLLEIKDNKINFVGTDGRRLALRTIEKENKTEKIKVLLSVKLMNILSDLLTDEDINISIGKNQIVFKFSNILLISQLLSGAEDFPEYEKVIPDEKKSKVAIIEKENFLSTLKRISLFTNERYNKLGVKIGKSTMVISVTSPEIGQGQEKISVEYEGEEVNFSFPPEFLIEFLQKVNEEKINFAFTENNRPVLLRPESDNKFLYVTMPLKTE